MTKNKWIAVVSVLAVAGLFAALRLDRDGQAQHFTARVERGDIYDVVEATGTINSVITVQVGSQVSGTIAKLNADFNSRVHKGDVVALIDPALFKGALLQATADLKNAEANREAARANLERAKATLVQTRADYDRAAGLGKDGVMSQQQLDLAKSNYDAANASVNASAAAITQAEAQISQKQAAVEIAQTNLDYTVIRSPIDGTVVARNVDVGQTVAASLQAPTIFTIAQDLTKMWVYVKTDESDVDNIKMGVRVTFKVDALPKQTFTGVVSQIRMNPTTVQSVVTYDTIIEFANPELKLFPGMTAYVTLPVATVHNVLKLPNTALRYRPPLSPEEVLALYKTHGIEASQSAQSAATETSADGVAGQNIPRRPKAETAVVWKLQPDKTMVPVKVTLGLTDHAHTEISAVLNGELKESDEVVIRSVMPKASVLGGVGR
jgi:HlyD family secretion protein